jgi:hypothetical protein
MPRWPRGGATAWCRPIPQASRSSAQRLACDGFARDLRIRQVPSRTLNSELRTLNPEPNSEHELRSENPEG